jgi:hypothetical protein
LATTVAPFPQALKPIAATTTVKHDPSFLVTVFIFSLLTRKRARSARPYSWRLDFDGAPQRRGNYRD